MYKASEKIKSYIRKSEKLMLKPYTCPAGVPTIGYGNTFYENGAAVKITDPAITKERAEKLFENIAAKFDKEVNSLIPVSVKLTQGKYDAIFDFAYNVGTDIDIDKIPEGLGDSTLLKKIIANPEDPSIKNEFLKWNKAKGVVMRGLTIRRAEEIDMYFKEIYPV